MTTTTGHLKLTYADDAAPLPGTSSGTQRSIDRRCAPRIPITGVATEIYCDDGTFRLNRQFRLLDYSDGGLGAIHDEPLIPGQTVSLQLPWDPTHVRHGKVVRCIHRDALDGGGYFVAIQFGQKMAA